MFLNNNAPQWTNSNAAQPPHKAAPLSHSDHVAQPIKLSVMEAVMDLIYLETQDYLEVQLETVSELVQLLTLALEPWSEASVNWIFQDTTEIGEVQESVLLEVVGEAALSEE